MIIKFVTIKRGETNEPTYITRSKTSCSFKLEHYKHILRSIHR